MRGLSPHKMVDEIVMSCSLVLTVFRFSQSVYVFLYHDALFFISQFSPCRSHCNEIEVTLYQNHNLKSKLTIDGGL